MTRAVAWAGLGALLALHLDLWRPRLGERVIGGLPEELVWRLAWMALAWAYLLWFLRHAWREEEP